MERVIRFYRIVDENQDPFPNPFPFTELQEAIDALPDKDAYVALNRMELLGSSWSPPSGAGARPSVPMLAIDRITREPQLRIERRRHYRPLVLGEGENLADPTFYAAFADGVLAVLRTSSLAPGAASFRDYVNHLEIVKPAIAVSPLVDSNSVRALGQVGTLTQVTLAVGPDVSEEAFSGARMIYDAIRGARSALGSVTIEVSVKIKAKGQAAAAEEAHKELSSIVTSPALGFAEKAYIKYRRLEDGRAATYDFIQEAITQTAVFEIDATTRQPVEASVAEGFAAAYDTLYEDIRSALRPVG